IKLKQIARAVRHPKFVGGGIHLPHPEMSCFGRENNSFLEFVQSLFLFHYFCDVPAGADVAGEPSLRVMACHALIRNPAILAIISSQPVLHNKWLPRIECLDVDLEALLQIVRVHAFSPAVSELLFDAAASKL